MFRKALALGLFASLLLSGLFYSPSYKAEEDEEYYENQPYLQYDFHVSSLKTKHLYNYTEIGPGLPGQYSVAFPDDEGFEYPEMEGHIYMRREYSQEDSQEFRKLAVKGFALYAIDQEYRKAIGEVLNDTATGVIGPDVAIQEIAGITNSTDSLYYEMMNKEISLEELITVDMIKWIRDEFDIESIVSNSPSTNLDDRISSVNESLKSYSEGNLTAFDCLSYISDESRRDYYHDEQEVDFEGPTLTINDVQAVYEGWSFESVGPSSSLLGPLSGNNQERLWIGQWMNVRFPNLTHTPEEYTVYFDWTDEEFAGKEINFHFSVGYGEIITEVDTENSVDYMGYESLEESYQQWVSFSGDHGSVKPVTIKFSPGYGETDGSMNWQDAADYAETLTYQSQTGHLATITTSEEADIVYSLLDSHSYWLGGFHNISSPDYTEPSGGWELVTGETFNHTLWPKDDELYGKHCYNQTGNYRIYHDGYGEEVDISSCNQTGWVWVSEFYSEPNEAGDEDCLEVWGFDKVLNDANCKSRGWMGLVVEYELEGPNHYEAYVPTWEWDEESQTHILGYVLAIPLTDEERNDILKEQGDPDADNDGIVDEFDTDDDNDGILDENDMDDDNDGIDDENDRCPGTPIGEFIDEEGCSASQILDEITTEDEGIPSLSFAAVVISMIGIAQIRRRNV